MEGQLAILDSIKLNNFQTPFEELHLEMYPQEIIEQFLTFIQNVPFIRNLISANRPRCSDLPRDEFGRAIIDLTNPPIFEDMEYFCQSAIHFKKYGCYSKLRPNPNKNSEYGKWFWEEVRRCKEGYVRPSDGMWVTGYCYFFLNYTNILQTVIKRGSKRADRVIDFPEVWEGIILRYHYIDQARNGGIFDKNGGLNGCEISRRGASKSLTMAAILADIFLFGTPENDRENKAMAMAYQKQYLTADGILNKFNSFIEFNAKNTEFPRQTLKKSMQDMHWISGYIDLDKNVRRGSENECMGVAIKDDPEKARGKRVNFAVFEEFGSFPRIVNLYNIFQPSIREGDYAFGQCYLIGTSGDDESDFQGASEIVYNPKGYNMYGLPNVYDIEGQGRPFTTFFFAGYLNRKGCYNKDGVSDVTKALLEILVNRYQVKYNSSDLNSITKAIAEIPIVPQEAILRSKGNIFPVTDLNERLNQIDNDPSIVKSLTGTLVFNSRGEVEFTPTSDVPIRDFPLKDNKAKGAIEIFELPEKTKEGKVFANRYIIGHDPVDDDYSSTMSLTSTFVLDLWTEKIVAEYTGRQDFAEDNFEIVRKLCLFYNAKCLYEAHPYSQKVITPDGIKLWADINIGDKLFSTNGRIVKVVDIPINERMPIYKITLKDGRTVRCSDNHIWNVYYKNKLINITTKEILSIGVKNKYNQHNFFIPNGGAVEFPYVETPIDPYTLGLLLAEGTLTKFKKQDLHNKPRKMVQFSSSIEDCKFYKEVIPYSIKKIGRDSCTWHLYIDDIYKYLNSLNLVHTNSHTKFIPELYLKNDYHTRLELLKGLMDGDGHSNNKGASIYVTTSEKLKDTFMELCRSLGMNCSCKYQVTTKSYRISIYTDVCIFKLPRKVKNQHRYQYSNKGSKADSFVNKTAIVSIEEDGVEMGKCVTVDSTDGLYLVGDYIVTHNCNKKGLFGYFSKMNCTYLLADTPEHLKDKESSKYSYGNKAKGIQASAPINNHANELIRDWLRLPITVEESEEGNTTIPNLFRIKNRALLRELVCFNPEINVDRVRALGMVMLYREDRMIVYGGNVKQKEEDVSSGLENDPFFMTYDLKKRGSKFSKI